MLMPSIFSHDLFDDVFDPFFHSNHGFENTNGLMKTDVKENENGYELAIDLPGVKKEDIKAELNDGYLTISATTNQNNDEQDANGKYLRRERFYGSYSRSFYVGENVTEEDIKAKYENGILDLCIPKKEQPKIEEKHYISIEG